MRSHALPHSCSGSNDTPHRPSVQTPHTISSACSDSPSDSSIPPSNVLPNRSNGIEPAPTPSVPMPVPPQPPFVYSNSYYQSLVHILIKLFSSSPASAAPPAPQVSSTVSPTSPAVADRISKPNIASPPCPPLSSLPCGSAPTPVAVNKVAGRVPKPYAVPPPCASPSSSSLPGDLSRTPCGSVSPKTVDSVSPAPVPASTSTPLSPLCSSLRTPAINTNSVPVPVTIPAPFSDSTSFSSRSPGLSCGSSSNLKVPTAVSAIPSPKAIQKTKFDNSSPRITAQTKPFTPPVRVPSSALSTLSGHNSAIINYLIKLSLCTQAPITVTSSTPTLAISKLCSHIMPKLNTPSDLVPNPETSGFSSIPPHLKSGSLSKAQPNLSGGLFAKPTLAPPPVPISIPTSTSGISSGYNPAFIKLLIKHLVSTPTSIIPHLLPSFNLTQPTLSTTTVPPLILNPFPKSNSSGPVSDLNPTVSNIMLNKSSILAPFSTPAPTTVPKTSFSYNQDLINQLFKVLSASSNDLKTPVTTTPISSSSPPFSYDSNSIPTSTLAPSLFSKSDSSTPSSFDSASIEKSDLSSGSALTLPDDLFPIAVTHLPVFNPLPTQVHGIISPKSSLPFGLCHRKHSLLSKLPSSPSSQIDVSPCLRTFLRPLAPLSPPCLKSTLKLKSGCKHPSSN